MGFAIFDIETRIDKSLLNRVLFAGDALADEEAYRRYLAARRERGGSDFMPVTMHVPISIAVGDVADNHVLRSVESLALEDYSEEKLVRAFWELIGMPGKGATDGSRVQELYEAGRMDEIHRYCRDDVIQTYFLFIRVELMRGRISEAAYRAAYDASAPFLAQLNG